MMRGLSIIMLLAFATPRAIGFATAETPEWKPPVFGADFTDEQRRDCDVSTSKFLRESGSTIERRSSATVMFHRPESGVNLSLTCGKFFYGFAGYAESRFPPRSLFSYVGWLGAAVLPVAPPLVVEKAKRCHLAALRHPDAQQSERIPGGVILCSLGNDAISFTIQRGR